MRTDTQSPALHIADSHDLIRVQGARENNLKALSVEIPKRRQTVFTGVSGSGKSSLVHGSIAGAGVVSIDQAAFRGSRRSNPATYTGLLDRLVDSGKSVIVIEHHQAVMAHADWIIDLGPGAGHDGGRIVFEGKPADLVAARSTLTGEHLAAYVGT